MPFNQIETRIEHHNFAMQIPLVLVAFKALSYSSLDGSQ